MIMVIKTISKIGFILGQIEAFLLFNGGWTKLNFIITSLIIVSRKVEFSFSDEKILQVTCVKTISCFTLMN